MHYPAGVLSPALQSDEAMLHPGNTEALFSYASTVRWTAPVTGLYDISTTFTAIDNRGVNVVAHLIDSDVIFQTQSLVGLGATSSYSGIRSIAQGGYIDFVVANGDTPGDRDWTKLDVHIFSVPEPSSALLLLSGAALLLLHRFRLKA